MKTIYHFSTSQNHMDTSSGYTITYSLISGGQGNKIYAGTGSGTYFSSILGGCNNTNAGSYSAILGGGGNTVSAAYSYAAIFGCNVNAVASCAFHANNLIIQNIPVITSHALWTTLRTGQLYTCFTPGTDFQCSPLYIK